MLSEHAMEAAEALVDRTQLRARGWSHPGPTGPRRSLVYAVTLRALTVRGDLLLQQASGTASALNRMTNKEHVTPLLGTHSSAGERECGLTK